MRVILIEEDRFAEVLELLRSECDKRADGYFQQKSGMTAEEIQFAKTEIFRTFNLHFVRWAQSHGASCVRR